MLKGASQMLTEQRIDIIELEAGMNRRNTHHVPFGAFDSFLGDRNYFLFTIPLVNYGVRQHEQKSIVINNNNVWPLLIFYPKL